MIEIFDDLSQFEVNTLDGDSATLASNLASQLLDQLVLANAAMETEESVFRLRHDEAEDEESGNPAMRTRMEMILEAVEAVRAELGNYERLNDTRSSIQNRSFISRGTNGRLRTRTGAQQRPSTEASQAQGSDGMNESSSSRNDLDWHDIFTELDDAASNTVTGLTETLRAVVGPEIAFQTWRSCPTYR